MAEHTEDNYVDWVLNGIREYYRNRGFSVFTYSIGQRREAAIPFDRIVYTNNKIIGFQFKPPSNSSVPWKYKFDAEQHTRLRESNWIYYALPAFVDVQLQNVALYHTRFAEINEVNVAEGRANRYNGWGAIAAGLDICTIGLPIVAPQTVEEVIRQMKENPVNAYVALNRAYREAHILQTPTTLTDASE